MSASEATQCHGRVPGSWGGPVFPSCLGEAAVQNPCSPYCPLPPLLWDSISLLLWVTQHSPIPCFLFANRLYHLVTQLGSAKGFHQAWTKRRQAAKLWCSWHSMIIRNEIGTCILEVFLSHPYIVFASLPSKPNVSDPLASEHYYSCSGSGGLWEKETRKGVREKADEREEEDRTRAGKSAGNETKWR